MLAFHLPCCPARRSPLQPKSESEQISCVMLSERSALCLPGRSPANYISRSLTAVGSQASLLALSRASQLARLRADQRLCRIGALSFQQTKWRHHRAAKASLRLPNCKANLGELCLSLALPSEAKEPSSFCQRSKLLRRSRGHYADQKQTDAFARTSQICASEASKH